MAIIDVGIIINGQNAPNGLAGNTGEVVAECKLIIHEQCPYAWERENSADSRLALNPV